MGDVLIDLTGQVFGMLTVVRRADPEPRFKDRGAWHCHCACGNTTNVIGKHLRRETGTRSCGCKIGASSAERHTTHGLTGTGAHRSWEAAKTRCTNPNIPSWKHYGGRGITMCDEWRNDFVAFLRDMGPRPEGHTIERIDHDGNYEPGNCRWATLKEQSNNTRANHNLTLDGVTHTIAEWEPLLGFCPGTVKQRILRGWTAERALKAPLRKVRQPSSRQHQQSHS